MGGKDDGHGPGVPVFETTGVVAIGIVGPLLNVLRLIGAAIEAGDVAKVGGGGNNVGIARIEGKVTTLAATHGVPVGTVDEAPVAAGEDADGGVVLLSAVEAIR